MRQEDYFITRIFRRFFRPLLLSALGLSMGGIVDALVVGRSMGEEGLAAIGFTMPVFMLFNLFDVGLGLGGGIHYSRLISRGKTKQAVALFNQVVQVALLISGLVAVLGNFYLDSFLYLLGMRARQGPVYEMTVAYALILFRFAPVLFLKYILYFFLRHDDNPKQASAALVLGNVVDVALSVLLVSVLGMGVEGAGYATVSGAGVSVLLCLPHLLRRNTTLKLRWAAPSLAAVTRSFRTGFASSVQYLYQFVTLTVFNHLAVRLGGITAVALLDVVVNMMYFVSSMVDSVTGTLQPMAATFFSERALNQVRLTLRLALRYCLVLSAAMFAMIFGLAPYICRLFGVQGASLLQQGALALRCYAVSIPFAGINALFCALYQSTEQERKAYAFGLLRMLLLPLALGYALSLEGLKAFWCVFMLYESAASLLWFGWVLVGRRDVFSVPGGEEERVFQGMLSGENRDLARMLEGIQTFCEKHHASYSQAYYVSLAVEEVCLAILDNAFAGKRDGYIQVTLVAQKDGDFVLHVRDNAKDFNPLDMRTSRIAEGDESGMASLGILLVKEKSKSFQYQKYYGFNTLRIVCGTEPHAEEVPMKKRKYRRRLMVSLGAKVTLVVLLMALFLAGFSLVIGYQNYASAMDRHFKESALHVATTAAAYMDGDKLPTYLETLEPDADYEQMLSDLWRIKESNDVLWLYVEAMNEGGVTYIMDADDPAEAVPLGTSYPFAEVFYPQLPSVLAGNPSDPIITNGEFGWLVTTYYPVFDSQGNSTAYVGVDISMDEVMADRFAYLLSTILGMGLFTVAFGILSLLVCRRWLVRPINELVGLAINFVDAQTEEEVTVQPELLEIRTGDEIEDLALAIAQMEQDTETHIEHLTQITAEKEKISAELGIARQIQSSMLPCIFPPFPDRHEFSIYAFMEPAREVGGDFYDFFMLDAYRLGMVIADVSGKGVPAALFMVVAKTLMKNNAQQYNSPADVLTATNTQLCEHNDAEMFVTAFLSILDLRDGTLRYANAGHNPPVVGREDDFRLLPVKPGFVLAGMEGMRYAEGQMQMQPNDVLILYTDGVTEAQDTQGGLYGEQRMLRWLRRKGVQYPEPEALLAGMLEEVQGFAAGAEQADDITMLALRFHSVCQEGEKNGRAGHGAIDLLPPGLLAGDLS